VPGIDNPNGPRTAGIYNKNQYIKEVESFWQFVVENKYNVEEADVALVLHPFINAFEERKKYGELDIEGEGLSWAGGYVVSAPEPGKEDQQEIFVTFGSDEAVKSCPHDKMKVSPEQRTVFWKKIVQKTETLKPVEGTSIYELVEIPFSWQRKQALTDEEALMVAREARKVFDKNPNTRIEFIVQEDGVYIREIAPWVKEEEMALFTFKPRETMVGSIVRIEKEDDVENIVGSEAIVYFSPEAFRQRTTDLFAMVANFKIEKLVVLAYGTVETSHAIKVLREAGINVILVGDKEYKHGDEVEITCDENGLPTIEFVDFYHEAVMRFDERGKLIGGAAGSKVANLALMLEAGFKVPNGFGITSRAVWQYLIEIGLKEKINFLESISSKNSEELKESTTEIRELILKIDLPEGFKNKINEAINCCEFTNYSIRSSGREDEAGRSGAGRFESSINVNSEDVIGTIKRTIASYFSLENIRELRQRGERLSVMPIGVGVHEYIPALFGSIGAVVFTGSQEILIEATSGSPEELVKGLADEKLSIKIKRQAGLETGEIIFTKSDELELKIDNELLENLVDYIKGVENLFGSWQDIELIIMPDGEIVLLQARPM